MTAAVLAAFTGPQPLIDAACAAQARGWRPLDAFTPFPIEALEETLALGRPNLPWVMLIAGIGAAAAIYGVQWWSATRGYPFVVGARPLNSWPAFVIASVELGILAAGTAGFCAMLIGSGLPRLNHPLFDSLAFERASQDQFVIALPVSDDTSAAIRAFLFEAGAVWIEAVEL